MINHKSLKVSLIFCPHFVLPEFPIKDTPQIPLQIQPIRKQDTMISWRTPIATTTIQDEYFCFRVMSSVLAQHRTDMPDIMVPKYMDFRLIETSFKST